MQVNFTPGWTRIESIDKLKHRANVKAYNMSASAKPYEGSGSLLWCCILLLILLDVGQELQVSEPPSENDIHPAINNCAESLQIGPAVGVMHHYRC